MTFHVSSWVSFVDPSSFTCPWLLFPRILTLDFTGYSGCLPRQPQIPHSVNLQLNPNLHFWPKQLLRSRSIVLIAYWTRPLGCPIGTSKCPQLNLTPCHLPASHTHSALDPPLSFLTLATQARSLDFIPASSCFLHLFQHATTPLNPEICPPLILIASLGSGPHNLLPGLWLPDQSLSLRCCLRDAHYFSVLNPPVLPITHPQDEISAPQSG